MRMPADSQRGVALLTILLLVVSITVVAGAMLASQRVAIRQSALLFEQNQLMQDIDAGQQLAVLAIRADSELNDTDSSTDIWATPLPPYRIGTRSVSIQIRDEAARFNINNLYHHGAVDTAAVSVFERLLTQLNIKPELAAAVLDWQDTDDEVYLDGGDEGTVYGERQSLPNQPFTSIEALQDVSGMDEQAFAALRPYISAAPYFVPININTASPVLLAALMDGGQSDQMQALITARDSQAFRSIDEIWQLPPFIGADSGQRQDLAPLLAVESQAFGALIIASANDNNNNNRQRFATVMISKVDQSSTANQTAGTSASNTANSENDKKQIQVVTQRLWPFAPDF